MKHLKKFELDSSFVSFEIGDYVKIKNDDDDKIYKLGEVNHKFKNSIGEYRYPYKLHNLDGTYHDSLKYPEIIHATDFEIATNVKYNL